MSETISTELITSELDDGVLPLILDDPRRRNALSTEMLNALLGAIENAASDDAVRVIIIGGSEAAFSAGHDLKELTHAREAEDGGHAFFEKLMALCSRLMQTITTCPKPVIAQVRGVATAAGCQLVASCDLAIAADTARFATPGVNIGLFCATPMVALSRNISAKHAMEMLLTGEMTSAQRAEEIGLVNRVVAAADLDEATMQLARRVASKPSETIAVGKRAFYRQREMTLADAYQYTSQIMADTLLDRPAIEGIGAFLEKRAPDWGH